MGEYSTGFLDGCQRCHVHFDESHSDYRICILHVSNETICSFGISPGEINMVRGMFCKSQNCFSSQTGSSYKVLVMFYT